jgi:outer membrane protein assembly factor BamB
LDYGNTPRATPLILEHAVVVLGAFGDLYCVDLETGATLWNKNLLREFGGELPTWGFCGTPLQVDEMLIVQTAAEEAALVALDLETGDVVWKSPGRPASYSSLILARLGSTRQIVGLDQETLGGWSPIDGHRLWEVVPQIPNDFNVPTPIVDEAGIFIATENNGARRMEFDSQGVVHLEAAATFDAFAPDTHTAVQVGDRIFGVCGALYCLDAKTLQPIWVGHDDALQGHASIVASNDSVLVFTSRGDILLVDAHADQFAVASRLTIDEHSADWYAHPAIVGTQLFVRLGRSLACVDLNETRQRD